MEFGVRLPHFQHLAEDPSAIRSNVMAVAQAAERLGYASVWVGDHVVLTEEESRHGTVWYEALTTLAFAAACTERVRLGTSILVAPYRSPVMVAKMVASLDGLSEGRVTLGVGTGWSEREFEVLGLSASFRERGAVTDEFLRAMRELWTAQTPAFSGSHVDFDTRGLVFKPRPVQESVPIWIGGNSDRAARRVVELGDAWQLVRPTYDEFRGRVEALHRICDRLGRDSATITLGVEHPMRIVSGAVSRNVPLVGTAAQLIDHVNLYAEAGAEHWLLDTFYAAPEVENLGIEQVLESMELFAAEVMPHV